MNLKPFTLKHQPESLCRQNYLKIYMENNKGNRRPKGMLKIKNTVKRTSLLILRFTSYSDQDYVILVEE